MTTDNAGIHVAIVGGGITGLILALGLQHRGVSYTLYERAPAFTEIGAGIGFSPNAERALRLVDPRVYAVYKQVASTTGDAEDFFNWVDGRDSNELVAKLLIGVDAFQGGRRSDFLEAWSKLLLPGTARFGKEVDSIVPRGDGRAVLRFRDGSTESADVGPSSLSTHISVYLSIYLFIYVHVVRYMLFSASSLKSAVKNENGV